MDLGTRYEYSTPKLDTEGRTFSLVPGAHSTVFPNAPAGLLFPGDPGAPRGANFPDRNDWAPRVGFAWDPWSTGKTSVRGGIGVFYDVLKGEDNLQFNGQPPFFSSAGVSYFNPAGPITNTIPYMQQVWYDSNGNPIANPFPSKPVNHNVNFAQFEPFNSSYGIYYVDPHLRTPYTFQYNLSIQQEIAKNTTLEMSYVGSESHKLTSLVDVNPMVLGDPNHDRILNLLPGNSTCSPGGTTICSYATAPEFRNVVNQNYNSLQASLTRQLTDTAWLGQTYFTFGYTWSHNIDNASGFRQNSYQVPYYDPNYFRASSDLDLRHRVTFSGGWDLAADKWWSSGPKRLTQGWSIYPIFTWRTGFPIDINALVPRISHINAYRFPSALPMFSSPAISGNTLYIGSHTGSLSAIDLTSQKIAWTFQTDGAREKYAALVSPDGTPNYAKVFAGDFYDDMVSGVQIMIGDGAIQSRWH